MDQDESLLLLWAMPKLAQHPLSSCSINAYDLSSLYHPCMQKQQHLIHLLTSFTCPLINLSYLSLPKCGSTENCRHHWHGSHLLLLPTPTPSHAKIYAHIPSSHNLLDTPWVLLYSILSIACMHKIASHISFSSLPYSLLPMAHLPFLPCRKLQPIFLP